MAEGIPDIAELLPQEPPMRLLDRVLRWSAERVEAEVAIAADSEFVQDGGVPSWVGLEYLAQAAAAYFALNLPAASRPRTGMLVGCPRYDCRLPAFGPGTVLTVRAWPASPLEGRLVRFRGEILVDGEVVADGELSVYVAGDGG